MWGGVESECVGVAVGLRVSVGCGGGVESECGVWLWGGE